MIPVQILGKDPELIEMYHVYAPPVPSSKWESGGVFCVYDFNGENLYSISSTNQHIALFDGVVNPYFSKKGVNTNTVFYRGKDKKTLLVAMALKGAKIKKLHQTP